MIGDALATTATPIPNLPTVEVIATTPVGNTDIPLQKFPGDIQTIEPEKLGPSTRTLPEMLNESIGAANISDTQGNPYQVDLTYRGFTASPVLGTPQGISVFLDGMRINEPFGDVVSWDIIPQIAISGITMIPGSNPVYGLNTLGGAVSMTTKSGNDFVGSDVKLGAGSYSRWNVDLEQGGHTDQLNYYLAASAFNDGGWALYNPSAVNQFFAKLGRQTEQADVSLSMNYAENRLHGNQIVPLSLMAVAAEGYSHPDHSDTQNFTINLTGNLTLSASNSLAGNVYYRHIVRDILNSNVNTPIALSINNAQCVALSDCPGSNMRTDYTQDIYGGNLQWSNQTPLFGRAQTLTTGLNTEFGATRLNNAGQDAFINLSRGVIGLDQFSSQASISSRNQRAGIFATDTLDLTARLALTVSARLDYATIQLSGVSCSDPQALCNIAADVSVVPGMNTLTNVTGSHRYARFNPAAGITYQISANLTAFSNYSEGFRTPSAIELACADPNIPCSGIPNAFSADPNLKAVVSRTIEFGFRGNPRETVYWHAAAFHSLLDNDILFNQANAVQGYFSNVGRTRRQGLEFGLTGAYRRFEYALEASWVEANFLSPFTLANGANSQCIAANGPGNGCGRVQTRAGDSMPGIPTLTLKARLSYTITPSTKLSTLIQAQNGQYARGDENNRDTNGQIPGFSTVKLELTHQWNKQLQFFGGISNLFDARYSSFGMLGDNNVANGSATQFRGIAAPRTGYAGFQVFF